MIKNFDSNKELKEFLKSKKVKLISEVTEGRCYLGEDKLVYKVLGIDGLESSKYELDKVICEDDIKLKSFAFPKDLYIVNKKLMGYNADYAGKDLFCSKNLLGIKLIVYLDFKKFTSAYNTMLKDVNTLSKNKIHIFDLPYNIIYDGKKFTGIDTLGYEKVNYDPTQKNLDSFNFAIEGIFKMCYNDFNDSNLIIDDTDIEGFLKKVENKLPKSAKKYREKIKSKKK